MNLLQYDWEFDYSPKMPVRPRETREGHLTFSIPAASMGSLHYLMMAEDEEVTLWKNRRPESIRLAIDITATEGAVVAKRDRKDPSPVPCSIRPMLCTSMYGSQFNRWWSAESIPLEPGEHSLEVSFSDLAAWSSVNGKPAGLNGTTRNEFLKRLQRPLRVALTASGGSSYGHGVMMQTGKMRVTIRNYSVGY